jgi:hypothetical protein
MKTLLIGLVALALTGCAVVPIAPYAYVPPPRPHPVIVRPVYPHYYYGYWPRG